MTVRIRICQYSLAAILALPLSAVAVGDAEFQRGDLIISSRVQNIFGSVGIIGWYGADGHLKRELYRRFSVSGYPGESAFGPDGLLYVPVPPGVLIFDRTGAVFGGRYAGNAPHSLVFDAGGNVFVAAQIGARVTKLGPDGQLLSSFVLPHSSGKDLGGIDLDPDQCTLYAPQQRLFPLSGSEILRYDVCENAELPSLAVLSESTPSVRILSNGSVLAANWNVVRQLDPSGQTVKTYDAAGEGLWYAVANDVSSGSFWAAAWGELYKFDLESGAVLAGPFAVEGAVEGITVVGAPRAAADAPSAIPTVSGLVLLALAIALAGLAAWKIR